MLKSHSDVLNLDLQGYKQRISVARCIDRGAERIHSAFIQHLKVFPVSSNGYSQCQFHEFYYY